MERVRKTKTAINILLFLFVASALLLSYSKEALAEGIRRSVGGQAPYMTEYMTPVYGKINIPVFVIEFKDVKFDEPVMNKAELTKLLFDENNPKSLSGYYKNASYKKLRLNGNVFFYETEHEIDYYKEDNESYELLAKEVLDAFDDKINFDKYDKDRDGYIDAIVFNVAGEDDYFYGCQTTWFYDTEYEIDGVYPGNYIIDDALPYTDSYSKDYYLQVIRHEFGHCMGLPDYYITDKEEGYDDDGFSGEMGYEMMDDMEGDFCQFSKASIGWLDDKMIKIYDENETEYEIGCAAQTGDCILIPRNPQSNDPLTGEFFMIQYDTPVLNNEEVLDEGTSGIRIFHVDAEIVYDREIWQYIYKYDRSCRYYRDDNEHHRILRLVNDGELYFKEGDIINKDTSGFAYYDKKGYEVIDPKIKIKIESTNKASAKLSITRVN